MESILEQYKKELREAISMKEVGIKFVTGSAAGEELAKGREIVPIEEYIQMWENGITDMENGADQEKYNF